jgi:hypothetical protein
MVRNGNECKNARNSSVAATFEKANTYVFAVPIIRDREVGGSNPFDIRHKSSEFWDTYLG